MALLFLLLTLFLIVYLITVTILFIKGKKIAGIIILIAMPLVAIACYIGFLFFIFSYNPPYDKDDAKEDLKTINFDLKDDIIYIDSEYKSSYHDESRYIKLIVSPTDKTNMIESIKEALNYNIEIKHQTDTINKSYINGTDTIFSRQYTKTEGIYEIKSIHIRTKSDTITLTIEIP